MEKIINIISWVVAGVCLIIIIYGLIHFRTLSVHPPKNMEDMDCEELFEQMLSGEKYCQSGHWEHESFKFWCLSGWMDSPDILLFAIEQGCIEFKGRG